MSHTRYVSTRSYGVMQSLTAPCDVLQLQKGIEMCLGGEKEPVELDMLNWMGRTALELIGQSGLGYSFDPLVAESSDEFLTTIKAFQ